MVIFNELNEFEGDHYGLKSFGPTEALGGANLKISKGKIGLVAYNFKSLFNTSILIKNIFTSDYVKEIQGATKVS